MDGIVVFLNGRRGMAVVESMRRAGHGIDAVVLPTGQESQLGDDLRARDLTAWPTDDANSEAFVDDLRRRAPNLVVVSGFSTILRRPVFEVPELGAINLHGGRLPDYRGGSPLNWQIINGESRIGISVLRVDEGIDTGDLLASASFELGADDTIADVHERANALFPGLVLQVLDRFDSGDLSGTPQDAAAGCYWHQRSEADGRLRPVVVDGRQACDLIRAVTRPYPGAYCYDGERKVRIYKAALPEMVIRGVPGRVCYVERRGPYVVCRDRAILLQEYEIEGEEGEKLRHGVHLH